MKLSEAEQNQDRYPDRHLNVFVAYRSHNLDYNVTRALVSTLKWSRPELTRAFLADLVGVESEAKGFHYDLHGCDYEDLDPRAVQAQVVLGISKAGRLAENLPPLDDGAQGRVLLNVLRAPTPVGTPPEYKLEAMQRLLGRPQLDLDDLAVLYHTLEELEEGCSPDGWIFSQDAGGVCVLIEAKLTKLLDLSQLQRYADVYYAADFAAEDMQLTTWSAVASFFAGYRDDPDARTAFLSGQLVDYLDMLGLAPFDGFKPYDFDLDTAPEVLPKFQAFAELVHREADKAGLPLGPVRVAPTGSRISLSSLPGELALDLRASGIRVEWTAGLGLGEQPGRLALDALLELHQARRDAEGAEVQPNPLRGQNVSGLEVRVERLRGTDPTGPAYVELETLHEPLDPETFGDVIAELQRQHPPAESSRDAAGHVRRGRLSFGRVLPHSLASGPAGALVEAVLAVAQDALRVARLLFPVESVELDGAA